MKHLTRLRNGLNWSKFRLRGIMTSRLVYIFLGAILAGIAVIWIAWPTQPSPSQDITLQSVDFSDLPHWKSTSMVASLRTFQLSCQKFLKQDPEDPVGNPWITLTAKDWFPACKAALDTPADNPALAKDFFETWLQPMMFHQKKPAQGLFTGYFVPEIDASLAKTKEYSVPIYGTPTNLIRVDLKSFDPKLPSKQLSGRIKGHDLVPFYSREEIDQGAIDHVAPILAYIRSPIDRLFLEIQGSGILRLTDGSTLNLGYAAQNGLPYTAIGGVLLKRGIMRYEAISLQSIQAYLHAHPEERDEIIYQNRSFVFFKHIKQDGAFGTQNVKLTPGYSLAVDTNWVPLGMPVWLTTSFPDPQLNTHHPLHRLMVAQDTGGAINGTMRGDVFWGSGQEAAAIAGKMKNTGCYWLLIPKTKYSNNQIS